MFTFDVYKYLFMSSAKIQLLQFGCIGGALNNFFKCLAGFSFSDTFYVINWVLQKLKNLLLEHSMKSSLHKRSLKLHKSRPHCI